MKNILLTGGAGYIGSHVANYLLDKGCKITIIDNLSTGHKKLCSTAWKDSNKNLILDKLIEKIERSQLNKVIQQLYLFHFCNRIQNYLPSLSNQVRIV